MRICYTRRNGSIKKTRQVVPLRRDTWNPRMRNCRGCKKKIPTSRRIGKPEKQRWPSSQNTPNEILVHGPASLLAWGAEDVPSHWSIKERILQMEETASEQETEGQGE